MTLLAIFALLLADDITQEERSILDDRRSMKTGVVELTSTTYQDSPSGLSKIDVSRFSVWFDGNNIRTDQIAYGSENETGPGLSHRKTARRNGDVLCRPVDTRNPERRFVADFVHPEATRLFGKVSARLYDVRLFGTDVTAFATSHASRPDSFVGFKPRTKLSREMLSSGNILVSFGNVTGDNARMEICADKGPNLLSGELRTTNGEYKIKCELAQYPSGRVGKKRWFPKTVVYTHTDHQGKCLVRTETTVDKAEFDMPIDETAFTFEGLGLEPGAHVRESGATQYTGLWNGREIVSLDLIPPPTPNERPGRSSLWIAIVFACVSIVIVVIYVRITRESNKLKTR